jgi:hypothetical protein
MIYVLFTLSIAVFLFYLVLKSRNIDTWFFPYLLGKVKTRPVNAAKKQHIYFCLADHFEPYWGKPNEIVAKNRVERWLHEYPLIADMHRDSDGNRPKHTFFYPEEEYDQAILDMLSGLCKRGYGDMEIHLHHDNDTAENLTQLLRSFKYKLSQEHGMLHYNPQTGDYLYGFIHGNWALDNSNPDGRWCGVNNELSILKETGCYADFTMPSAPNPAQVKKINSIYFAQGRPGMNRAHESGIDVRVGHWDDNGLLMIQGPLTLNWKHRKFGVFPKIENGELSYSAPPDAYRVELWKNCHICITGADEHIFIKTYTHGAMEPTMNMFFSGGLDLLWRELERQYRDREGYALHYVTAWEMYKKIQEIAKGAS